jgi:hypothetical protein
MRHSPQASPLPKYPSILARALLGRALAPAFFSCGECILVLATSAGAVSAALQAQRPSATL